MPYRADFRPKFILDEDGSKTSLSIEDKIVFIGSNSSKKSYFLKKSDF